MGPGFRRVTTEDGAAERGMSPPLDLADPERALAVVYAPPDVRAGLAALFALDERLGQIVTTTIEPMIGLMRLAWWREALAALTPVSAPAEPLLKMLARQAVACGVSGAMLAEIEDGWAALIDGEPDAEAIARHGRERGGKLFAAAARLLGVDDPRLRQAGEAWALADLAHRHSQPAVRATARAQAAAMNRQIDRAKWPGAARPLAALYVLARADMSTERRRQASPGRLLRMLALRLFGR